MVTIHGHQFPFNPLNAAHLELLDTATKEYVAANETAQAHLDGSAAGTAKALREDAQNIKRYLCRVLGDEAPVMLDFCDDDYGAALQLLAEVRAAIDEAVRASHRVLLNSRAQKPQQRRHQKRR